MASRAPELWRWISRPLIYLILGTGAVLIAFPFLWMVLSSFKSLSEINLFPPTILPLEWHPENYVVAWTSPTSTFARYFMNSAIMAFGGVLVQVTTSVLAAYAFAHMRFPGRNAVFVLFLASMMIPGEVTLIPNFVTIRHVPFFGGNDWAGNGGEGLYDSVLGLILPSAASAIGIFLLRQAMMTIPRDYWDAAQVDGCGRFRFLWSIALPLVSPAVTTVAVFAAFQYWNALLWPLVVTGSEALRPVQVAILYFQGEVESRFNLVMAAATFTVLPGIIFYFFAQRHFVEGLSASGIKG